MAKNKELDEELEEEVEEEETQSASTPGVSDFKQIVITECKRIINQYIDICRNNNDEPFIKMLQNEAKKEEWCINHIMNNLTSKRIYGGADSLMYEYIHEYYVDDKFTEIKDEWSSKIRNAGSSAQPKELSDKEIAKRYAEIPNEVKTEMYQKALAEAEKEAKYKAQEELRKREEKRKQKEKEALEKKKAEEEVKRLAEAQKPKPAQMSLFDL